MAPPSSKTNRLASETSPYLLQHAHNPVDWYPWGDEAFAAAHATRKPILLSIGYAACHWCHVMAHESFEDEATAELMNRHFINIKVDREERPDVDRVYMDALHLMGEQGGWPLTMFLDEERRPFWGGTYFPPISQYGRPSFKQVLNQIAHIWTAEPDKITTNAQAILLGLQRQVNGTTTTGITDDMLPALCARLIDAIDWENGGFGGAPKFPQSPVFQLLWTLGRTLDEPRAIRATELTMTRISQGGIYDHLAGGIARYTVDERWLVPHFEKMLYDNAQYVSLLAQLHDHTPNRLFRTRIEQTIHWLLEDMMTSNGLFASSYDADSEGQEGKYYCWQASEIDAVLDESSRHQFKDIYDVSTRGNWEHQNILNRLLNPDILDDQTEQNLDRSRSLLLEERKKRILPGWDDKTLADWNGLTIQAFARASVTCSKPAYLTTAIQTFDALTKTLHAGGALHHSYRNGQRRGLATADDYAHLISACIMLYETSFDARWITEAATLTDQLIDRHSDPSTSAFTMAPRQAADLIILRPYWTDDVTPNANAAMVINLAKLAVLANRPDYTGIANRIMSSMQGFMTRNAFACPTAWIAWLAMRRQPQIIVTGSRHSPTFQPLHQAALKAAHPHTLLMWIEDTANLEATHPAYGKGSGLEPTAYVCENQICGLPITDPAGFG